jgi:hypothetical protein
MPCVITILQEARAICEKQEEGDFLTKVNNLCSKHLAGHPKKKDDVRWFFCQAARLGLIHTTLNRELFLAQLQEIVEA